MAEKVERQKGDSALPSDIDDKKLHHGVREARDFTIETHISG